MSEVTINDSILETVRKLIGGEENGEAFDQDLIIHINSVFEILYQLGVGTDTPFYITDETSKWSDFIDGARFRSCVSYVVLRVKILFDTPNSSFVTSAIKDEMRELEWRLTVQHDEEVEEEGG